MSRVLVPVVVSLATCIVVGLAQNTAIAQPRPARFDVEFSQLAEHDDDFDYAITLPRIVGRPPSFVRYSGPTGSGFSSDGRRPTFVEQDFATLGGKAFGTWQLSLLPFSGLPEEVFEFTIAPFGLDVVFTELSTITAPSPGAIVPEVFDLTWDYPQGERPSGRAVRWTSSSSGLEIAGTFAEGVDPRYHVTATFNPGFSSGQATFRAGSHDRNPTQVTGDAAFLDRFAPQSSFANLSAPATYRFRAIPEPTNLVLAGLGLFGLATLRDPRASPVHARTCTVGQGNG